MREQCNEGSKCRENIKIDYSLNSLKMANSEILRFDAIKKVLILGAGTLGLRVGLQYALSGFDTTIYDIRPETFDFARNVQKKILAGLIRDGKITQEKANKAWDLISWSSDAESAARDIDFVNESVTENVEIKKAVWKQFGQLCPPHAVFTTNTSYLLPSLFSSDSGRPGRFCAFHFHDVFYSNVVDIMPHSETEEWVIPLLYEMAYKLYQIPIFVKKESPGYVFNHMLGALLGAAFHLVTTGVASIEDVDRSWMGNFKMPSGPFGIMDTIGLETIYHVTKNTAGPGHQRTLDFLIPYLNEEKLGVKTGEGFYKYPNPAYLEKDFLLKGQFQGK
jgi:3-hydroxybutyryl-CoA dehydrogenase